MIASDSRVGSAEVNAASNGMIASAYTNQCRALDLLKSTLPVMVWLLQHIQTSAGLHLSSQLYLVKSAVGASSLWVGYLTFRKIFCSNILDRATGLVGHLAFKKCS